MEPTSCFPPVYSVTQWQLFSHGYIIHNHFQLRKTCLQSKVPLGPCFHSWAGTTTNAHSPLSTCPSIFDLYSYFEVEFLYAIYIRKFSLIMSDYPFLFLIYLYLYSFNSSFLFHHTEYASKYIHTFKWENPTTTKTLPTFKCQYMLQTQKTGVLKYRMETKNRSDVYQLFY